MKIIKVDSSGNEQFVCENIDEFHGRMFVYYMNHNQVVIHQEETYKMVDLDHEIRYSNK